MARQERFDIALTEFVHRDVDGTEVCRSLSEHCAVIVLSEVRDSGCVVAALESGADKYVFKPCPPAELAARIRSLLRRVHPPGASKAIVRLAGGLEIDRKGLCVSKNGITLPLTRIELDLLLELARRPGAIVSHEVLSENVWGYGECDDGQALRAAIKRLRRKIEDDPRSPRTLLTARGIGYFLAKH